MTTVNIQDAKTNLSRLIELVGTGLPAVISKAGTPIDAPARPLRIGSLAGVIAVPDDFNRIGSGGIAALFDGAA